MARGKLANPGTGRPSGVIEDLNAVLLLMGWQRQLIEMAIERAQRHRQRRQRQV